MSVRLKGSHRPQARVERVSLTAFRKVLAGVDAATSLEAWRACRLRQKFVARRRAMGLSQDGLAELLGYCRESLALWECGQRVPSFRHIVDWRQALGV